MSWIGRLLKPLVRPTGQNGKPAPNSLPTVKFDPASVSEGVRADLRHNIALIGDVDKKHFESIYQAAVKSISAGGDLHALSCALMDIDEMPKQRAAQIARSLNNKAMSLINRERQASLGITHTIWMYSNAPCIKDPRHPDATDIQQDAAHRSADGKRFELSKGLLVDGKRTWPGIEEGCKCMSRAVLPGLEE